MGCEQIIFASGSLHPQAAQQRIKPCEAGQPIRPADSDSKEDHQQQECHRPTNKHEAVLLLRGITLLAPLLHGPRTDSKDDSGNQDHHQHFRPNKNTTKVGQSLV